MQTRCSICDAPTASPELCSACAGLLRWVRSYFAHVPGLSATINPNTRFIEDLGVDSLDWMNWPLEAQEKLGVVLSDRDLERLQTVRQFIRALRDAGANWPDSSDVRLRPRRGWCSPYLWDVVEAAQG